MHLSDDLQDALNKSSLSLDDLVAYAVANDEFIMEYETLSSPFQYGGSEENEFTTFNWGGDKETSIDLPGAEQFRPSFKINDFFESLTSFSEFINQECGRSDYINAFYDLFASNKEQVTIIYNTDYDLIRAKIKEDTLIEYLSQNPKKEEEFTPKKLKISKSEYQMLVSNNDGFCLKCGKINENFHEPDARKYACSHCDTNNSYGVSECLIMDDIEIVEDHNSELDDAY